MSGGGDDDLNDRDRAGADELHATLRRLMRESRLCDDGPALARTIESAYRQFWHAWCFR